MSIDDTIEQIKQRVDETQATFTRAQRSVIVQSLAIEAMRRAGQCHGAYFWQEMRRLLRQTGLDNVLSTREINQMIWR
jgi:hypothetical protein